jgi:hypothetical protein
MDKFVVDLDRILDDLEAQELQSSSSHVPGEVRPEEIPIVSPLKRDDILSQFDPHIPAHPVLCHQESETMSADTLSSGRSITQSIESPQTPRAAPDQESVCNGHDQVPAGCCSPATLCLSPPSSSQFPHSNSSCEIVPDFHLNHHTMSTPVKVTDNRSHSNLLNEMVSSYDNSKEEVNPRLMSLVDNEITSAAQSKSPDPATKENDDEEEEILAKVMRDVEEYEKSRGPVSNSSPDVYDDEELNKIMKSISDWQKTNGKVPSEQNGDDSDGENEYDEDLAKLTNGLVSHASSLRPGKEISHKTTAPESPTATAAATVTKHQMQSSSQEIQCISFDDCRVDSDELSEDQMNAYLNDVRLSPQPDPPAPVPDVVQED